METESVFHQDRDELGPKIKSWLVGIELLWLVSEDADEDVVVQLPLDRESLNPIGQILILGATL